MPNQKKIDIVKNLKVKFSRSSAYLFVDFRGLAVSGLNELRKELAQFDAEFQVAKNSLIEKAVALKNEGPTAVLFARNEALEAIKTLVKFAEKNEILKIKSGLFEGRIYSGEEIVSLARLPTKVVLIGQLAATLKAPLYRLANVLSGNQRQLVVVLNEIAKRKH